jgi:hypothetical protein
MWTGIRRCFGMRWGSWGRAVGQSRSEGVEGYSAENLSHRGHGGTQGKPFFCRIASRDIVNREFVGLKPALISERFARC